MLVVSAQAQVMKLLGSLRQEFNLSYLFIANDLPELKDFSVRASSCRTEPYTRELLETSPEVDSDIQVQRKAQREWARRSNAAS